MLPNDPVFRFMNYHVRVFVKRYYHLRVFFKIFALALFSPDWTPLSGHNGSIPPGRHPKTISYFFIHFIFTYSGTVALSVHENCFSGAVAKTCQVIPTWQKHREIVRDFRLDLRVTEGALSRIFLIISKRTS